MKNAFISIGFILGIIAMWIIFNSYSPKVSAMDNQIHILSLSNQVQQLIIEKKDLIIENRNLLIENAVLRVVMQNMESPLI